MTTSLTPDDERARKREAIGLTSRRPTARRTIYRPPDREGHNLLWLAVLFLVALALGTGWMVFNSLQRDFNWFVDGNEPPQPVLEDDFNSPYLALAEVQTEGLWHAGFVDGYYRITVEQPGHLTWSTLGLLNAGAYRVETAMRLEPSPDNAAPTWGYGGLLVRYSNDSNFYLFAVDGGGAYQIQLQKGGIWQVLQPWTAASALQNPGEPIHLGVSDDGSLIRFWGNGELLFTLEEPRLPSGDIGLAGGTRSQGQASALFDWVKIYEIPLATH